MTATERLLLLNQYEILSLLNPEDSYYSTCKDILENGYEFLYSEITGRLHEPLPEVEGRFVMDVLQMHRTLTFSYMALEDKEGLTEQDISFGGFDGNEEGKHYSFAKFLMEDFERFEELKDNEFCSLNSHANMIPKYSRMLEVFTNTADKYSRNLSAEKIREILEA